MACALCATETTDAICSYHARYAPNRWAETNRILNDLLMRGIAPKRLPLADRQEADAPVEVDG